MIVPRIFPRDPSGRVDIITTASSHTCIIEREVKGSWGADRRLEWDVPRLARGQAQRTDDEEATWRVLRILEQRTAFESWLKDEAKGTNRHKLGARGWKEHNANDDIITSKTSVGYTTTTMPVVAAVSSVGLAYVHEYIALDPTVKIVVLMRPREQVVESFLNKSKGRNHWQKHPRTTRASPASPTSSSKVDYVQPDKTWDNAFPNMSEEECRPFMAAKDNDDTEAAAAASMPDKASALRAYWELYNHVALELSQRYPNNVWCFDMHAALNDISIQEKLLRWCLFDEPTMDTSRAVHLNKKKLS
jgi:hypothetical protein